MKRWEAYTLPLLATVALLFSLNYIISKLGLHAFSPMTFAYLRVLGSALILNLLFRQRDLPPLSRSDHWRVIGYAVLGVVINQYLFLSGLALTSAHVSAILMTLIPVFTLAAAIVVDDNYLHDQSARVGGVAERAGRGRTDIDHDPGNRCRQGAAV